MSHDIKHDRPPHGGSFTVQKDGSLKQNVAHEHAAAHETPAAEETHPAGKTHAAPAAKPRGR